MTRLIFSSWHVESKFARLNFCVTVHERALYKFELYCIVLSADIVKAKMVNGGVPYADLPSHMYHYEFSNLLT